MSLRPDCKRCGWLFTEENTYWYRSARNGQRIRKCRNCQRMRTQSGCNTAPLPRFFVGPVVGTDTCDKCEPWAGKACSWCLQTWESVEHENSYAEAM